MFTVVVGLHYGCDLGLCLFAAVVNNIKIEIQNKVSCDIYIRYESIKQEINQVTIIEIRTSSTVTNCSLLQIQKGVVLVIWASMGHSQPMEKNCRI